MPYYDFKKIRENNFSKDSFKNFPEKTQPLSRDMGKIIWSDANGTFILPLDKSMSIDSLQKTMELIQKLGNWQQMGTLIYANNGTRVYALPQDNMPCLVPDMSQFNMPVLGKGTQITGMPPGSLPPNEIIPKK